MTASPLNQQNFILQDTRLVAQTANTNLILPAGCFIRDILMQNSTANAVTGGITIGTTNAGTDIAAAIAVGANANIFLTDALLLKRFFSASASQQIFFNAVAAWNSASLQIDVLYYQL